MFGICSKPYRRGKLKNFKSSTNVNRATLFICISYIKGVYDMSKYELYMQLDKWYRIQSIKILPKYFFAQIKQRLSL